MIVSDIVEVDNEFKRWVGEFVIAFSQLEHGIAELCTMSKNINNDTYEEDMVTFIGMKTSDKLKTLSNQLKDNYPDLIEIWAELKPKIDRLNHERRFIVHGIYFYTIGDDVPALIKVGRRNNTRLDGKRITISKMKGLCNEVYQLISGKNGVNGEFWEKLGDARVALRKNEQEDY